MRDRCLYHKLGRLSSKDHPCAPGPRSMGNTLHRELTLTIKSLKCTCCGREMMGTPNSFSMSAPWPKWSAAPDDPISDRDFKRRVKLTADTCIVDEQLFWVRGVIELPIIGAEEPFMWGVWASIHPDAFADMQRRLDTPGRENDPPTFGWLLSEIPGYDLTTELLKVMVHTRPVGLRPWFEVEPGSHLLATEQTEGISIERWHRLVDAASARLAKGVSAAGGWRGLVSGVLARLGIGGVSKR